MRSPLCSGVAAALLLVWFPLTGEADLIGWTRSAQFSGASICSLAVSTESGGYTSWAGTPGDGIYVGHGTSPRWARAPLPHADLGACPVELSPDYATDHTLIAVSDQTYLSRDAGRTWSALSIPLPAGAVAFSPSFASDRTMLAAADSGPVFRSTDAGVNWTQVADWQANLPASGHFIVNALQMRPDGTALLATGGGIFRSADAGETWSAANVGLPVISDLDPSTGQYYRHVPAVVGLADGGAAILAAVRTLTAGLVFRSLDGGITWSQAGKPISALPSAIAFVAAPDGPQIWLGTHDRGVLVSRDGGKSWSGQSRGLSDRDVAALAAPPGGNVVFVGASFDGEFSWVPGTGRWHAHFTGMPQTDPVDALLSLAPGPDSHAYAGSLTGLFRSSDGGETWRASNDGLPGERSVLALASGYSLFAATSSGVFRSIDAGRHWTVSGSRFMRGVSASAIAVTGSRVAAGTENGLFLSRDDGASWHRPVLGDMNVQALAFGADAHRTALYAICAGQLEEYDGSRTHVLAPDLASQPVVAFAISPMSGRPDLAATAGALFRWQGTAWRRVLRFSPVSPPILSYIGRSTILFAAGQRLYRSDSDGVRWQVITTPLHASIEAMTSRGQNGALISLPGGIWRYRG